MKIILYLLCYKCVIILSTHKMNDDRKNGAETIHSFKRNQIWKTILNAHSSNIIPNIAKVSSDKMLHYYMRIHYYIHGITYNRKEWIRARIIKWLGKFTIKSNHLMTNIQWMPINILIILKRHSDICVSPFHLRIYKWIHPFHHFTMSQ